MEGLKPYANLLDGALGLLKHVNERIIEVGQVKGREHSLADATLYLEMFGIIAVAWQWLLQGLVVQKALKQNQSEFEASFYQGKYQTMRFFFHYELPKVEGLSKRLLETDGLTKDATTESFVD